MIAAVCIEERNGMLFGGRRLSRDRILCRDLLRLCGTVWVEPWSAPLFEESAEHIRVDDQWLDKAGPGEVCFVERDALADRRPEGMILYRWNRRYPADLHLACLPWERGMTLCSVTEFAGSSHERITREIWRMDYGERNP